MVRIRFRLYSVRYFSGLEIIWTDVLQTISVTPVAIPIRADAKKGTMSAAARKRIGEATRKRWAAFRAKKAAKEK